MLLFPTPAFRIEYDIPNYIICRIFNNVTCRNRTSNSFIICNIVYLCKIIQSNLNTRYPKVVRFKQVSLYNEANYIKTEIKETYRELLHALYMMDTEWFHVFQEVYLRNIQIRPKSLDNI